MAKIPRRILLIWIGRLGDLLVSTPFINALRLKYPQAEITLLARSYVKTAAPLLAGIDKAVFLPSGIGGIVDFAADFLFRKFDLCVDLNSSYSRTSGVLTLLSKAGERVSFDKYRAGWFYTGTTAAPAEDEHMLARYGRLARFLEAEYSQRLSIKIPAGAGVKAAALLAGLNLPANAVKIAVHPGNFKKFDHRWPEEKFISLCKKILALPNTELILMSGPGEERHVLAMQQQLAGKAKYLPPQPLDVTAAFLQKVNVLVVSATGTMHLAAAAGTPMLSFHSGYTYKCWRPMSENAVSLASKDWNSCRDISVDEAWLALTGLLAQINNRR